MTPPPLGSTQKAYLSVDKKRPKTPGHNPPPTPLTTRPIKNSDLDEKPHTRWEPPFLS